MLYNWMSEGSRGLPVVGHLLHINLANPYPFFDGRVRKYGPIFRLQLGSFNAVMMTDFYQIKRALNSPHFTYRPTIYNFETASLGFHGILFSNGSLWHEQRRFVLRQLRDLGMGKSRIEANILREIQAISDQLKQRVGKPTDLNYVLNIASVNILWTILAGKIGSESFQLTNLLNAVTMSHNH